MYSKYIKRILDIVFSLGVLVVLSPMLLVLIICNAICMKGNPFFVQLRPGKDEKIFKLIKFRTMTCEKDENGELLPDEIRLTKYGKFLRSTSLDELPELLNIIKGDMSIIGPRPLLVQYLPLYNERQRKRHMVRPGLTGYAQVKGRNCVDWEQRFKYDVEYVENLSLCLDIRILLKTIEVVFKREGISSDTCETMEFFRGNKLEGNGREICQ